jgi:hypothetical protein
MTDLLTHDISLLPIEEGDESIHVITTEGDNKKCNAHLKEERKDGIEMGSSR